MSDIAKSEQSQLRLFMSRNVLVIYSISNERTTEEKSRSKEKDHITSSRTVCLRVTQDEAQEV